MRHPGGGLRSTSAVPLSDGMCCVSPLSPTWQPGRWRAALPGVAVGFLLQAAPFLAAEHLGAVPRHMLWVLAGAIAGLAVGHRIPAPGRGPMTPARLVVLAASTAGLALWLGPLTGPVGGLLGTVHLDPRGLPVGAAVGAAVVGIVLAQSVRRVADLGQAQMFAGMAAGTLFSATLPPWLALVLAGPLAALASMGDGSEPGSSGPVEPLRLAALLAIPAAVVPVLLAIRVPLDPSPRLLLLSLVFGMVGLAGGRAMTRGGPVAAAAIGGVVAAGIAGLAPSLLGVVRLTTIPVGVGPAWLPRLLLLGALPAALTLAGGGAAGLVWGRQRAPWSALAIAAGLVLGASPWATHPHWWMGITGALAGALFFFSAGRMGGVAGAVLSVVLGAIIYRGGTLPSPPLATGLFRSLRGAEVWDRDHAWRDSLDALTTTWGPAGSAVVRIPQGMKPGRSRAGLGQTEVEVEGSMALLSGRGAHAESLAGHVAALLAPRRDQFLVLGDDGGRVFDALTDHPVSQIEVAVPLPITVQGLATLDGALEAAWLSPTVRLRPLHPELALRTAAPPAAVVEVFRSPWADAAHAAPTPAHLREVRAKIGEHGIYVACIHLDRFEDGAPGALVGMLADHFDHLQLWLPPEGADALVIVASDAEVPLRRLPERFSEVSAPLVDLKVTSALQLVGLAVGDEGSARAWASGKQRPASDRLSGALLKPPVLHMGGLAAHTTTAARIWSMEGATLGIAAVQGQIDVRKGFLELLDQAARGNMEGVFEKARGIESNPAMDGANPLAALAGPQLEQARKALRRAIQEGPQSAAWTEAEQLATTARMMSPSSTEPLLILGEIALAQSDLTKAEERFSTARKSAPDDLGALMGLARVARARRDPNTAEILLREAVATQPQSWQTWQNLGTFLMELDRSREAEEALQRAVGLAGGEHPAPNLALAELLLDVGRPSAALPHAQTALVIEETGYGHLLIGRSYFDMDQFDRAEEHFRQAVLKDPNLIAARGAIGTVRAMRGDYAAAAEQFRAVLRMDPGNVKATENLKRAEARQPVPTRP